MSSEEVEVFHPQIVQSPLPTNSLFSLSYFCKNWKKKKKKIQVQTSSLDTTEASVESLCNLGSPSIAGNFSPFK